jgi:hypothetical protein
MAKKQFRPSRGTWLMPLVYALPVVALAAAALLIWGDKIRDLIGIAVKLAVIS